MDWWLLTFFTGAILSLFLPIVPAIFYVFLCLAFVILFILYKPLRNSSGIFLGCAWILFNAVQYQDVWQANQINEFIIHKKVHFVEGKVLTLQSQLNNKNTFNLRIEKNDGKDLAQAFVVRIRWNKPTFILAQGQQVLLNVKLKPAHGFANPGGFNYQSWLHQKNIVATGYVIQGNNNQRLTEPAINNDISFRQKLFSQYETLLPERALAPLLPALAFGERGNISSELWQVLKATGTQHLIAISGLHLGLIASGSFLFFVLLIKIFPISMLLSGFKHRQVKSLSFNSRYFAIAFSLIFTFGYAYLAGFSIPTIRAFLMLLLYWMSRLLNIKLPLARWLLLTVFISIIITPFSLFSASFWLSFYAVCIIFLTLWRLESTLKEGSKFSKTIKSLLIIQVSLTLLLMPITAVFYQQISLAALFANIIAVPLMSLVSIPLCLFSVISLPFNDSVAAFFMSLTLYSLEVLWLWLTVLEEQQWSVVSLSAKQVNLFVILSFIGCIWWFLSLNSIFKNNIGRVVAIFLGLSSLAFFSQNTSTKHSDWQVNVLDVGQGLAVVIERNDQAILYDTAAAYPSGFNLVDSVILPYLQQRNISHLDKVIISHSDNDHAGGLNILKKSISIEEIIFNTVEADATSVCLKGQSFQWQGLQFKQLWPEETKGKENDDSCVVQISDGQFSVLLTGDISKKVEYFLAAQSLIAADVLVAPHHGSKTSSSELFINKVAPSYAIFSAGYLNRWSMPNKEVVQRFHKKHIKTYNTATSGMVRVNIKAHEIDVQQYRQVLWPYWFSN